jgi:phage repressor protein C with HTH and peptisase S24 domain
MLQPDLSETETLPFNILPLMESLAERIAFIRKGMGLTQDEFADALNQQLKSAGSPPVTRGAVGNWEKGSKGLARRNMDAVADMVGTTLDWIGKNRGAPPSEDDLRRVGQRFLHSVGVLDATGTGGLVGTVEIYGQAAGSTLAAGTALLLDQQPIGTLPMLPGLVGLRDVYGLEVTGDSMLPMYRPGDPVYVSPHSPASPGDPIIVIEHKSRNGNPTAFIKILQDDLADRVMARQLHPTGEISFMKSPGLSTHKVLSLREILGYAGAGTEPLTVAAPRPRRGPKR